MPVELETLGGAPLFADLEPALLDRIAAISSILTLQPGERLFAAGEHPACLYLLRSGQVALGRVDVGGDFVAIEVLRPGDFFGSAAVLLERPSVMAAETIEQTVVVCIAAHGLRELIRSEPSLASAMLASLATSYRGLVRQVLELKSRSVAQRLGCYLLALAHEQTTTEVLLPFEKRLLASRLGTTPESLSRAFNVLRTCGVSTVGRKVTLAKVHVLSRFARPDDLM